eukprot:Hpha_TRINITY_DN4386_c0_g2::TRINITY_DN4386_c0_g2_i1::g.50138::m.50138
MILPYIVASLCALAARRPPNFAVGGSFVGRMRTGRTTISRRGSKGPDWCVALSFERSDGLCGLPPRPRLNDSASFCAPTLYCPAQALVTTAERARNACESNGKSCRGTSYGVTLSGPLKEGSLVGAEQMLVVVGEASVIAARGNMFHMWNDWLLPLLAALPEGAKADVVAIDLLRVSDLLQGPPWAGRVSEVFKQVTQAVLGGSLLTRASFDSRRRYSAVITSPAVHKVCGRELGPFWQGGRRPPSWVRYLTKKALQRLRVSLGLPVPAAFSPPMKERTELLIVPRYRARRFVNENELRAAGLPGLRWFDPAKETLRATVEAFGRVMGSSGLHGAGLTNWLFHGPGAVCVQMLTWRMEEWKDRLEYKTLCESVDGLYMDWKSEEFNHTTYPKGAAEEVRRRPGLPYRGQELSFHCKTECAPLANRLSLQDFDLIDADLYVPEKHLRRMLDAARKRFQTGG